MLSASLGLVKICMRYVRNVLRRALRIVPQLYIAVLDRDGLVE